ncbi:conserved exported hypothetical protein [Rubrivivax sp. A210]|nr:conserved exported hypothetical protein [Rubrivivax sp. A210]
MNKQTTAGLIGLLAAVAAAQAADAKPPSINDFLADTSGGYVGAAGIIGMDGKLVRDTSTPKELVASINAVRSDESKDGIGIAFSPGRSRFETTAIDISKVEFNGANGFWMSPARRLWGSTTFSYAQNRTTIAGIDYRQRALAVNVEYFFDIDDDPTFAAYKAFAGMSKQDSCSTARKTTGNDAAKLAETQQQASARTTVSRIAAVSAVAAADTALATATAASAAAAMAPSEKATATKLEAIAAASAASANANAKKKESEAEASVETALADCAKAATKAAKDKWNTPKATLLFGRGQINSMGAGDPRLSLGNHLQFTLSASPEYVANGFKEGKADSEKKNLVTIAYHRAGNVLDTSTIGGTPAYKTRSNFAARYIREMGGNQASYLLAEISTAKSRDGGTDAGTYKYALGLDYKLGANMWLELRSGRSVARTGNKDETKTLMSLKFSPSPALSSLFAAP